MKQYIPPNDLQLDDYEKDILDAYDRGELVSRPLTPEELQEHKEAARNTLKRLEKNKNLNLRVNSQVIDKIKEKAQKAGIPYQTLIGTILHQYASGKLKIEL